MSIPCASTTHFPLLLLPRHVFWKTTSRSTELVLRTHEKAAPLTNKQTNKQTKQTNNNTTGRIIIPHDTKRKRQKTERSIDQCIDRWSMIITTALAFGSSSTTHHILHAVFTRLLLRGCRHVVVDMSLRSIDVLRRIDHCRCNYALFIILSITSHHRRVGSGEYYCVVGGRVMVCQSMYTINNRTTMTTW